MKKLLLLQTVLLLSSISATFSFGQSTDFLQRAYQFIEKEYGLDQSSIGELIIKDQYRTAHNNAEHVYLAQAYNGIELYGTSITLTFVPSGKIFCSDHRLKTMDQLPISAEKVVITPTEAISVVANSLGISSRAVPSIKRYTDKGIPVYEKSAISLQDIPVELLYHITPSGEYHLVWKILLSSVKDGNMYQSYVNVTSGGIITNELLTLHCRFENGYLKPESTCVDLPQSLFSAPPSPVINVDAQYRILPLTVESPSHGSFELVSGTEDPIASPFGWHDTNEAAGAEYTYTRGNNVHAFLDRNWDYTSDVNVDGGANLVFDFPFNSNTEPVDNQNVAATNLFYWNNIMHDVAYRYGMDESWGCFQQTNYTGQGADGDYVEAHAQFGDSNTTQCGAEENGGTECINNADFSTPPDGFNGRMRMFTWTRDNGSKYLDVLEPIDLSGKITTGLADFGPDLTIVPITGEVVIVNDGSFDASKACNPITGQPELAGKIALIDRGLCDFSYKVFNAQEAGAIGAIICNFEDAIQAMGAGDNAADVTIPSVFISSQDCNRIRIAAGTGLVVSLVAPSSGGPVKRDGSLDNGIVSHEYTHGISNRLTGGPSNTSCLSNGEQMGEGWSDFFALVTTVQPGDVGTKRRGVGTYAIKEQPNGKGIRSYPYSTDMDINPETFASIQATTSVHAVGAVWCDMIWDLYWALSDAYGWDPDLYEGTGGNNIAIQLVMDGMKIQPCNPGFINGRDAILMADSINNGGANTCLIWSVFARRGLGFDADGGDPDVTADGKEGFALPLSCRSDLSFSKTMSPEVIAGENIEVTLTVINYTDETLTNVFVEDPIPNGCSYQVGSGNIEPAVGNSLVWSINSLAPDEKLTIIYLLKTDQAKNSIRMIYDDMEGDPLDRWDISYDPNGTITNFWFQVDLPVHSGVSAMRVEDIEKESEHFLQNYDPYTISGDYPVYRFYHYYNTEAGADGGFLEISTDDGQSWIPFENKVFRNGYPRKLQYGTFAIPNLYAYSGLSSATLEMIPVYIDLRDYVGEQVKIRYRFGTDSNTAGDGWTVDDVEIMDAILYNSLACVISDQTDPICAEAPERGTIVDSQITISTDDTDPVSSFTIMPNPAGDLIQVVMSSTKTDNASVRIYNLTGHLLATDDWGLTEGINQKTMDISKYASGLYVIQITTRDGMRSEKFVKE